MAVGYDRKGVDEMSRRRTEGEWLEVCEGIDGEGLEVTVGMMADRAQVVYMTAWRVREKLMKSGSWRWGRVAGSRGQGNRVRGRRNEIKVLHEIKLMISIKELVTVQGIAERVGLSARCVRNVIGRLRARGELAEAIKVEGRQAVVRVEPEGPGRNDPSLGEIGRMAQEIRESRGMRVKNESGTKGEWAPRVYRVNRPRLALEV